MTPRTVPIRVLDIEMPVEGVKVMRLDPEATGPYRAGQYLNLLHPHEEVVRSYSFVSCPETDAFPSLCFKRIPNGRMSRYLYDQVSKGDQLLSRGVQGLFSLPDPMEEWDQLFFFAAGIGITPVISMIKSAIHQNYPGHIILVYANRSPQSALFRHELDEMVEAHPRFHTEWFYSSHQDLLRARLNKQVLEGLVPALSRAGRDRSLFYTCGPMTFMRMIQFGLIEQGYDPSRIRREHFHTQVPVTVHLPPDRKAHKVELRWKGEDWSFISQYPRTLLQSAREAGLDLPYSCEAGFCGSCMMYKREGQVWHKQNEVLTDRDIQEGKVLTCVAYPQGGPLILGETPSISGSGSSGKSSAQEEG